jgi:hypothetical protein
MNHPCARNGKLCGHRRSPNTECNSFKFCHYLLDTGKKRPCPPGKACTEWTDEKCKIIVD